MANLPLPEIFEKVQLNLNSFNTSTGSTPQDTDVVSGTFMQVEKCFMHSFEQASHDKQGVYLKDEKNVKRYTSTGLGSAQSHSSQTVEPVKVDEIVMHYIKKNKAEEYERIQRNKVNLTDSKGYVTFTSMSGDDIYAQLARQQFITFYQKTATGLQTRTYNLDLKMMNSFREEFPEILIEPSKDKPGLMLTGNFISLDRFETSLDAKRSSRNQIPDKAQDYGAHNMMLDKTKVEAKEEACPICLETIKKGDCEMLPKCKHCFCKECLKRAFQLKPACPICGEIYGSFKGTQPKGGTMIFSVDKWALPGYEKYGTITINYNIPSGVQGAEHPNPGKSYQGASRTAYLPDSSEGRKVLKLLERAFQQRLTFTIGRSSTTGINNVVTWNDIHHKTSRSGGPTHYGYPDPEYLKRVQDELKAKGID